MSKLIFRGYTYTHPQNPQKGDVFFNKTCQKLFKYTGKKWVEIKDNDDLGGDISPKDKDPDKAYKRAMDIV